MRRSSAWRSYKPGRTRAPAPAAPTSRTVRILGLDPGSRATGFGVVDVGPEGPRYVASGAIRATGEDFPRRLQQIYAGVAALVEHYAPGEIAIERVFVNRNADSALKLGQARGAALSATFGSQAAIYEYTPRAVKLGVVGTGAAEKPQVQRMVGVILGLDGRLGADAADALAIAICHAHGRATRLALAAAGGAA
ncbi:MAG TPA: crossover junction endodeoxyribonuclease RuvC [Steroidobacteraceae bacterium]|nr:crossover junction endodeoxyribonuclease RuvC [Steroidobacteraceae bacterium]